MLSGTRTSSGGSPTRPRSRTQRQRLELCTIGNNPALKIAPECNQQFARQDDDADALHAFPTAPKAVSIPRCQRTVRLMSYPPPRDLHDDVARMRVARARDALIPLHLATLIGGGYGGRRGRPTGADSGSVASQRFQRSASSRLVGPTPRTCSSCVIVRPCVVVRSR
jgi:hypothetical protein